MAISEAATELRQIARDATDATGYFPALYSRVTGRISKSIELGRFEDGSRKHVFATAFASYYTRVVPEGGRPRCWQTTWDLGKDAKLLIVQHLLLGINAHVNHDLPQAVVDVARRTGSLAAVRSDFDAVNDVLAATYTDVLGDLDRVSRWANEAAALGGGRIFNFSLRVARRQAWEAAERMYALEPEDYEQYVLELDRLVSVLAFLITRPLFPASTFVRIARSFEEHDPGAVAKALLGNYYHDLPPAPRRVSNNNQLIVRF
jgi:hypothetical protein